MVLGRHRLFAVMPHYGGLVNNLIVTTDRLIMGSRTTPLSRSGSQGAKSRITPAPLVWSVALRASRDITIQASIEYVCLTLDSHLVYLYWFSGLDEAVSISTSRTSQVL